MLIFSQSWMTHSSPAASEMQGGHSGHRLRENFGPLAHVDRPMPATCIPCMHPVDSLEATKRIPIRQMRAQRPREAEQPVQSHTMRRKQDISEATSF